MKKGNIVIIIAAFVLVSLPVIYFLQSAKKPKSETVAFLNKTETIISPIAPLPTGKDIINTFFNLINEGRIPEAIAMMDESMVPDDQTKQAWGVSFNSLSSVNKVSIIEYNKQEWTADRQFYKTIVNVVIKPGSNVIWEQGDNTRWITLQKQADIWKIHEIATGP